MSKFHSHKKLQFILKTNLKCIPIQKGSINVFENSFWAYGAKRVLEIRIVIFENLKIIFESLENNFLQAHNLKRESK